MWHNHRIPILFVGFFVLLAIRLLIYRGLHRQLLPPSPSTGPPNPASSAEEKSIWQDEKQELSTPRADSSHQRVLRREDKVGANNNSVYTNRPRIAPRRVKGSRTERPFNSANSPAGDIQPLVFFFSLTSNTERCAVTFAQELTLSLKVQSSTILPPKLHDLSYIDYDDFFISTPKPKTVAKHIRYFYLFLIPTYNIDSVMNTFISNLQETHHDFRIDTAPLSNLVGYSVFGFGDMEGWKTEEEGFCSQAREVDRWMAKLSGKRRAYPLGMGDVKSDVTGRLQEWRDGVTKVLIDISTKGGLGEGVLGSGDALESDEEIDSDDSMPDPETEKSKPSRERKPLRVSRIDDLEDLGGRVPLEKNFSSTSATYSSSLAIDFTTSRSIPSTVQPLKEMVPTTSPTYTALTKQGYTIIGSHSGVKICRWTKSALRGRGSCYKYSFYGIKSHLCMETTPSLSCSNKCVFCWRHGTNPVGTTWRWKVDPPEIIFTGAKEAHLKKIKMMRGVPGVRAERFQEAMKIRHCALSLVGEPIFYPHINDFVSLLHGDRISSFLVCNAQHPDQLEALKVVTQLYVSIDASNKESLKKVDRPLHRDFWERFLRCLDILREKRFRMRTVFRLTLVKGFNIENEVEGYADLVQRGMPCFVEVKGVTYCGTSSSAGAGLTMQNVPFYEEVVAFVEALSAALEGRGLDYGIAAEHAHSCCILIGSKRFLMDGKWHTLIDYDRFFELLESGEDFAPEDYAGPTLEWAAWGRGGFDPADVRVRRKGKNRDKDVSDAKEAEAEKEQREG
ncbi:hypothetical protein MMC12_004578 [Toensbergia leucococca]|nr:hypothetical protein [Toensbergia leucococca]